MGGANPTDGCADGRRPKNFTANTKCLIDNPSNSNTNTPLNTHTALALNPISHSQVRKGQPLLTVAAISRRLVAHDSCYKARIPAAPVAGGHGGRPARARAAARGVDTGCILLALRAGGSRWYGTSSRGAKAASCRGAPPGPFPGQ
eukprot:357673-Chlamydomonas_euryale.AAC.4